MTDAQADIDYFQNKLKHAVIIGNKNLIKKYKKRIQLLKDALVIYKLVRK